MEHSPESVIQSEVVNASPSATSRPNRVVPLAWVVCGLVAGVALTGLILKNPFSRKHKTAVASNISKPAATSSVVVNPPVTVPAPKTNLVTPQNANSTGTSSKPSGPAGSPATTNVPAMPGQINPNPGIGGPIISHPATTPPAQQSKPMPVGPPAAVSEGVGQVALVSVVEEVGRAEQARTQLSGIAKNFGGSSRRFMSQRDVKERTPEGLLVLIPPSQLEKFLQAVKKVGPVVAKTTWTGTPGDRQEKLTSAARERLFDLEKRKSALMVKYYEDAPEVKDIQEQIDGITAMINALHLGAKADTMAGVIFEFTERD